MVKMVVLPYLASNMMLTLQLGNTNFGTTVTVVTTAHAASTTTFVQATVNYKECNNVDNEVISITMPPQLSSIESKFLTNTRQI